MMARADPTVDARGFCRRSPHSLEMVGRETIQRLGHRRRTPRHWHNYSHLGTIRHCLHKTRNRLQNKCTGCSHSCSPRIQLHGRQPTRCRPYSRNLQEWEERCGAAEARVNIGDRTSKATRALVAEGDRASCMGSSAYTQGIYKYRHHQYRSRLVFRIVSAVTVAVVMGMAAVKSERPRAPPRRTAVRTRQGGARSGVPWLRPYDPPQQRVSQPAFCFCFTLHLFLMVELSRSY